ncbi:MAG: lipoprotein [Sideroxyarcus sp.]|nr:lipoprotein [Sideroxyarcus sp.]
MRTVGIMLLLLVALQGCGRKGPLFLPPPPSNEQTTPGQTGQNK